MVILVFSCDKKEEKPYDILDSTFNSGTGVDDLYSQIHCLSIMPNGKIIIGGNFISFDKVKCNNVLRLNSNGTIDNSFKVDSSFNWTTVTLALQPDGKIIVGGAGGTTPNYICRLNADGSIDRDFYSGIGFNWSVYSLALQPDGKIIVGGEFTSFNGIERKYLARLNRDGTLDDSFNPGSGFNERVFTVLLQSDGKILVGGNFTAFNGIDSYYLVRLNNDGTIDKTFNVGTGFNSHVLQIKAQSDGEILVCGSFSEYNGASINRIVRLQSTGTIDLFFNASLPIEGDQGDVISMEVQKDNKIIISGRFSFTIDHMDFNNIERLNSDGTRDSTYKAGNGFDNTIYSMSLQNDDKLICVGGFRHFNGTTSNNIARLNKE
jgi:uncharacterized delta-60 repeat protein